MADQEVKNERMGMLVSAASHVAVLVLFIFLAGWRAPDPPLPEYGVELNFGLDDQGSGEDQPEKPVGSEGTEAEDPAQTNPEKDAATPATSAQKETAQKVNPTESPVTQEQAKENSAATKDTKLKDPEPKPLLAVYKKPSATESQTNATAPKKGEQGSQGDDANKKDDKGSPEGKLDPKASYTGTPGGGGGGPGTLSMEGWDWAVRPKVPELPDNENGKVSFEIECDQDGAITKVTTIESSLSPRSTQLLKEEIQKSSLTPTSAGKPPPLSKGLVTIRLTVK